MAEPIKNRYDFVVYYDVENGNPNGDPDAGNMPRIDPETGYGLVTDVCLKRKIRNYVETMREGEAGFDIYVKKGVTLNSNDERALMRVGINPKSKTYAEDISHLKDEKSNLDCILREYMCNTFFDIRTFGAVMTSLGKSKKNKNSLNCGQVRGPVQLTFSRSVDPIIPQEITITREAITTEEDAKEKTNEFAHKYIVPYGLYRCEGYVSANLARKVTGFSEDDLEFLWSAIMNMFEIDHSAARGKMVTRSLIVFKHDTELGCAPSHKLFELVTCKKREGVEVPRSFADYGGVEVDETQVPDGVQVIRKL